MPFSLILILILPFVFQFSPGGFIDSGGAIMWSVLGPLGALMFPGPNSSLKWFIAYLALVITSGFLNEYAYHYITGLEGTQNPVLFVVNIVGVSIITYIIQRYFVKKQEELRKIVEKKHVSMTDSISYAKRIQEAQLPSHTEVKRICPDSMVLYQPKDIVSGDFFWMAEQNNIPL